MSASGIETRVTVARQVAVSEDALTVHLADGRTLSVPLSWYPRLWHGTSQERSRWRLIGDGEGIHWPELDEDISVEGLLRGRRSGETERSLKRWLEGRSSADTVPNPAVSSATNRRRWTAVIDVEGIGEFYAEKLKAAGIATTEALLKEGATPAGRKKIQKTTGIGHALILRWINHVDLFRIKGIQKQYAELLEASGVDSIPELAQRDPAHLHPKMAEVNEKKKLVRKLPTPSQVAEWVKQAKNLHRVVSY